MSAGNVITTAVFVIGFIGLVGAAILGIVSTGRATQETTDRKKSGPAGGTPRRAVRPRKRRPVVLSPESTVTLAEVRRETGVDEVFAALDADLVGLVPVKKKVEEIGSLLLVDRVRQMFGLDAPRPNLHKCFTGAPGTGETTVALRMADLLHRLGYLEQGHLVH